MIFKFETKQTKPYHQELLWIDDKPFGDELNDNAYVEDGFRFHDLYHIGLYEFFNYKKGVFATLRNEVEPNKQRNKIEESVVMFMFQIPKYKNTVMMHNIMFDTLCDVMKNQLNIEFDPIVLSDFIDKVSEFRKYLENNPNTEFVFCEKKYFKNL